MSIKSTGIIHSIDTQRSIIEIRIGYRARSRLQRYEDMLYAISTILTPRRAQFPEELLWRSLHVGLGSFCHKDVHLYYYFQYSIYFLSYNYIKNFPYLLSRTYNAKWFFNFFIYLLLFNFAFFSRFPSQVI